MNQVKFHYLQPRPNVQEITQIEPARNCAVGKKKKLKKQQVMLRSKEIQVKMLRKVL